MHLYLYGIHPKTTPLHSNKQHVLQYYVSSMYSVYVKSTLCCHFSFIFMVHIVIYNQWSSFFIIIFWVQYSLFLLFIETWKWTNIQWKTHIGRSCIWSPIYHYFIPTVLNSDLRTTFSWCQFVQTFASCSDTCHK